MPIHPDGGARRTLEPGGLDLVVPESFRVLASSVGRSCQSGWSGRKRSARAVTQSVAITRCAWASPTRRSQTAACNVASTASLPLVLVVACASSFGSSQRLRASLGSPPRPSGTRWSYSLVPNGPRPVRQRAEPLLAVGHVAGWPDAPGVAARADRAGDRRLGDGGADRARGAGGIGQRLALLVPVVAGARRCVLVHHVALLRPGAHGERPRAARPGRALGPGRRPPRPGPGPRRPARRPAPRPVGCTGVGASGVQHQERHDDDEHDEQRHGRRPPVAPTPVPRSRWGG